jgi:hypothetical protein
MAQIGQHRDTRGHSVFRVFAALQASLFKGVLLLTALAAPALIARSSLVVTASRVERRRCVGRPGADDYAAGAVPATNPSATPFMQ